MGVNLTLLLDLALCLSEVVDRCGANLRAERALAYRALERGEHSGSFTQRCEVHIIFQSNKAAMDVMQADLSGLISVAMSQQGSGTLSTLRKILGELIVEELEISYAMPPRGGIASHRESIHALFLPQPARAEDTLKKSSGSVLTLQRRLVLNAMCNGDLSSPTVQHYCSYGCCSSVQETEMRFSILVPWALMPHKCPRLARNKWTGQAEAVNWCGLLANHHGLLERLMARWVGKPQGPVEKATERVDAESAAFLLSDNADNADNIVGFEDAEPLPEDEAMLDPDVMLDDEDPGKFCLLKVFNKGQGGFKGSGDQPNRQ